MTQGEKSRRRGRPTSVVLTRERITRAAVDIIAKKGAQGFTLDALATELSVSTSALYNHAASKATVLLWVQDEINAAIDTSVFERLDAREAVLAWARSYREAYAAFSALIPVMAVQPIGDAPRTTEMYEAVVTGLVADGWDASDALNVIVAIEAYIFGAALDLAAPDDIFDPGSHAEPAPQLEAAIEARRLTHGRGRSAADAAFDLGLPALIDGLWARR